ncbi:hypothetical protein IFM89_004263 [Coptis chinensis]|uniref:GPI ethanolamine phosphate transferase 3 n=1 Tax=Coptis chinensis TaxID=261450 RepID=A0A835IBK0_9MAGN|nr:hypothetical protein IFM89_004263 [Coptis chinensis]
MGQGEGPLIFLGSMLLLDGKLCKGPTKGKLRGKPKRGNHRSHTVVSDPGPCIALMDVSVLASRLCNCQNLEDLSDWDVVDILKNQSGPGGLHENTLLIVMGDHGQTLNGDHGGGTSEEVETSLFAMSLKTPLVSVSSGQNKSRILDSDGKEIRVSSIQQLDFAVTVAALLGVPFPFGSIGRVNHELYALSAGTWSQRGTDAPSCKNQSNLEEWMQNYANVLCINSWQVKRYINTYSESSVIGFPSEDLAHLENMYAQAQHNWSNRVKESLLPQNEVGNGSCSTLLIDDLQWQIEAYSNFLASVTELARSKWTEFDLLIMAIGLGILLLSLFIHLYFIERTNNLQQFSYPSIVDAKISLRSILVLLLVAIRGCSFLSNSYILTEGKVANYLLGTTGIINLRYSVSGKKMLKEAVTFLLMNLVLRISTESGFSKQTVGSAFMDIFPLRFLGINENHLIWVLIPDVISLLSLIVLAIVLCKSMSGDYCWRFSKYLFNGATIFSYFLITVHWVLESNLLGMPLLLEGIGRSLIPRIIYTIGFGLLVLLTARWLLDKEMALNFTQSMLQRTVVMLSAWSPTVILIMGRQGPLIALSSVIGGWCIIRLGLLEKKTRDGTVGVLTTDPLPVVQWSFFAVCLFFYTGHWCAFDGLRYGAAFTGQVSSLLFDEFNLIRQAILLSIDTFGVSHILPILGCPLLVIFHYPQYPRGRERNSLLANLAQVLLIYGLITSITTTFTVICVTIQRRHLMVWGLFAPKFVFDVVGLILTDFLICFSSLHYFPRVGSDTQRDQISAK